MRKQIQMIENVLAQIRDRNVDSLLDEDKWGRWRRDWDAGSFVDEEYVLQEDGDNRIWSNEIIEMIIISDNVNQVMQDNEDSW